MSNSWDSVLSDAVAAQRKVDATPSWMRSKWLEDIANAIEADAEALAEAIVEEGVKTIREAKGEVARAALTFRLAASEVGRDSGGVLALDRAPNGVGRLGIVLKRPLGVVLGITPFNDPLNLVAHKIAPALAAGNAIIIKPDERTSGVAGRLVMICQCSGLPDGAVTIAKGDHAAINKLIRDPLIAMVSFTGGRVGGASVAQAAAGKPTSLELGGVASTIVLADADLKQAIPQIVSGMFAAAGQNCLHVQRVIVEAPVYDAVLAGLVSGARALVLGNRRDPDTDMGRLIDATSIERCVKWVDEAVSAGATVVTGGSVEGETFAPTILTDVPVDCRVVCEEVFGPISVIEHVADMDAAFASASRTGAALAAGVFTRSLDATHKLGSLPVGQVVLNGSSDFRVDHMPFGGAGAAGLGREGLADAIKAMTDQVIICHNVSSAQNNTSI
ncbi:MAG: aldehyde dehydrogenase family protein [Pseudoruegeria sp.]